MTAEPVGRTGWAPDTFEPKRAGYTDEVLDPDDASRVELSDGVPSAVPSPTAPFDIRLPIGDITP